MALIIVISTSDGTKDADVSGAMFGGQPQNIFPLRFEKFLKSHHVLQSHRGIANLKESSRID
jgi:hypothetical protein